MASNLNVELSDTLFEHGQSLEYANCEKKEIQVYELLTKMGFECTPTFYGSKIDEQAEIYVLFMERLERSNMLLFNSENNPESWSKELVLKAIHAIHAIHKEFVTSGSKEQLSSVVSFEPVKAIELYRQFNRLNAKDYEYLNWADSFHYLDTVLEDWKRSTPVKKSVLTLVHNDYNPRNVGVRLDGSICMYDWELASFNIPQRDVFEFLAFTLSEDFSSSDLTEILAEHYRLLKELNSENYSYQDYLHDFKLAGDEFLLTRVSFYLAGSTLVHYPFINRVFEVSLKMIQFIQNV